MAVKDDMTLSPEQIENFKGLERALNHYRTSKVLRAIGAARSLFSQYDRAPKFKAIYSTHLGLIVKDVDPHEVEDFYEGDRQVTIKWFVGHKVVDATARALIEYRSALYSIESVKASDNRCRVTSHLVLPNGLRLPLGSYYWIFGDGSLVTNVMLLEQIKRSLSWAQTLNLNKLREDAIDGKIAFEALLRTRNMTPRNMGKFISDEFGLANNLTLTALGETGNQNLVIEDRKSGIKSPMLEMNYRDNIFTLELRLDQIQVNLITLELTESLYSLVRKEILEHIETDLAGLIIHQLDLV